MVFDSNTKHFKSRKKTVKGGSISNRLVKKKGKSLRSKKYKRMKGGADARPIPVFDITHFKPPDKISLPAYSHQKHYKTGMSGYGVSTNLGATSLGTGKEYTATIVDDSKDQIHIYRDTIDGTLYSFYIYITDEGREIYVNFHRTLSESSEKYQIDLTHGSIFHPNPPTAKKSIDNEPFITKYGHLATTPWINHTLEPVIVLKKTLII